MYTLELNIGLHIQKFINYCVIEFSITINHLHLIFQYNYINLTPCIDYNPHRLATVNPAKVSLYVCNQSPSL